MDLFDFGTLPQKPALATPAANGTSTMEYKTEIDFALNRRVLSDFRALFNAPAKDSVFIEIEWGDITDIYGTVADGSIDSSTELSVSLLEAFEDSSRFTMQTATADFYQYKCAHEDLTMDRKFGIIVDLQH